MRRLQGLAERARLRVVQPIPWFPLLRPLPVWAASNDDRIGDLEGVRSPMFYIPGAFKSMDGYWLYRSVREILRRMKQQRRLDIVDAHFGYPDGSF